MAFATADDVAVRLGRDLTTAEEAMVEAVIEGVQGMIALAAGKDDDWADDLDPVPAYFKMLVVEKALIVGTNPNGLRSEAKTLGAVERSRVFRDAGVFLTDDEEDRVRVIVGGTDRATFRVPSLVTDLYDAFYPPV